MKWAEQLITGSHDGVVGVGNVVVVGAFVAVDCVVGAFVVVGALVEGLVVAWRVVGALVVDVDAIVEVKVGLLVLALVEG